MTNGLMQHIKVEESISIQWVKSIKIADQYKISSEEPTLRLYGNFCYGKYIFEAVKGAKVSVKL